MQTCGLEFLQVSCLYEEPCHTVPPSLLAAWPRFLHAERAPTLNAEGHQSGRLDFGAESVVVFTGNVVVRRGHRW
jgi:hypothetical protein